MAFPILQFGTSRFLQAHFDLFVDQGYAEGSGKGKIAVVQTTSSPDSARRLAFFDTGQPYAVRLRGLDGDKLVDQAVSVASVGRGVDANANWAEVERLFVDEARWIVSNTGDRGYELDEADALAAGVPRAFPAKLAKLLHARFRAGRSPPTLFPCELIEDNGDKLRALVLQSRSDGGSAPTSSAGSPRIASGSTRSSTASSPSRWSPRARSPSPMRCGRSRTGPASSCPASTPTSSSPTISRAMSA